MASSTGAAPSLPLILARELAANLATPMFLIDASGTLVFFNDAAELVIGKSFGELGEVSALEFGAMLTHPSQCAEHHFDSALGFVLGRQRAAD